MDRQMDIYTGSQELQMDGWPGGLTQAVRHAYGGRIDRQMDRYWQSAIQMDGLTNTGR